jgi:iron(III) transport system substrate-binding protein
MAKWILILAGIFLYMTSEMGLSRVTFADTITLYSGRTEELVGPIIDRFSKETGIDAKVRYGKTAGLAATILEEGRKSRADVFFAQDPAGLGAVAHMLGRLPEDILKRAELRFRSSQGRWVGISGRARTVVYNTERVKKAALPDDIRGFIAPAWKGRIGWAPTNGSFQAMVTAMRVLWGEEKTRNWLEGIHANGPKMYPKNTPIVGAVGAGEIEVGFVNHYYLLRFLKERGKSFPARNYHPRAGGPGAMILVAGAGILETSKNKRSAERFLTFLLSPAAQQYFAEKTFEYPVIEGVEIPKALSPLTEIRSPKIMMSDMTDLKGTLKLLRKTGVLP